MAPTKGIRRIQMYEYASRRSHLVFASGANTLTVAGGDSIHVCGMLFHAATAAEFLIQDGAAGTTLFTFDLAAAGVFELQTKWIADAGLSVTSDQDDGSITVFHKSPGT